MPLDVVESAAWVEFGLGWGLNHAARTDSKGFSKKNEGDYYLIIIINIFYKIDILILLDMISSDTMHNLVGLIKSDKLTTPKLSQPIHFLTNSSSDYRFHKSPHLERTVWKLYGSET